MRVRRFGFAALLALAVFSLASCFPAAFELVELSPAVSQDDVPIDATITAVATTNLDPLTVTVDTVRLLLDGTPVAAAVSASATNITLDPDELLDFGAEYEVVVSGLVADENGTTLAGDVSWTFTTRYLTVETQANSEPVAGASVIVDGIPAGTTDATGALALSLPSGGSATLGASRTFFVTPNDIPTTLDGSVYEVSFELAPYVFVPDFGNGSVVRMPSVDAPTDEYDTITSVPLSAQVDLNFQGPIALYTDYENGQLYILDAANVDSYATLIRLSSFPPAPDGSDTTVSYLTGQTDEVRGAQQIVVRDDGTVLLVDWRSSCCDTNYYDSRLVQLPADLNFANATFGTWQDSTHLYGLAELPDGRIVAVGGTAFGLESLVFDSVTDATPEAFGSFSNGSGDDQFDVPTRPIVGPNDLYVYVGDTGDRNSSFDNNSRVVRIDSSGGAFASYGTRGSGTGQFQNPLILGILPDNRLYIMDVTNARLVRIDPDVFSGGGADWAESSGQAGFSFEYWYNYS